MPRLAARGAALAALSSRFGCHVAAARIPLVRPGVATIGTVLRAEVWYARADDGVTIAYSVVGDGPVTIVVVSPLISQLELAWEEPRPWSTSGVASPPVPRW
jgi:hypothetical protein